jgi:tetratricopeptide (TPR) repeat protein
LRRDGDQVDKQQLDQLANPNDDWDDAQRSELAMGFASLFLSLREMDRATKLATSVAESPTGQTDLSVHMMLFDIASMTDNSELMAQSLTKVKEIDKSGALWRVGDAIRLNLEAGRAKENTNRASQLYKEAIRQLTEAAVIRPAWSRIPRLMGEIYDQQGNADSALESYMEAIDLGDYAPNVVSRTLTLLFEKERFVDADIIIRKTQDQKSPVSSELSRMASEIYMQMEDYDRALDVATRNAIQSDSQEDHLWLAQIYARTNRDDQAEQEFRTSIAKDPSAPAPWVLLIQYYARKNNREAALLALADAESQIRESDRDNAVAQAYQSLGDFQNADKYYKASLAKTPDSPGLLRRYAEFLLLAGAPRLAEPILTKLIAPEAETSDVDRAWGRRSLALMIGLRGNDDAVKQARELLNANISKFGFTVEDKRVLARVLASRSDARSTDEAVGLLKEITQNTETFSLDDNYLLAMQYKKVATQSKKPEDWNRYFATMRENMQNGGAKEPPYVYDFAQTLIAQGQIQKSPVLMQEGEFWLDRLKEMVPNAFANVAVEAQILYGQGNYAKIEEMLNTNKDLPGGLEAMAILAERLAQLLERDNKADVADKFWKFAETSFDELTKTEASKRSALAGFLARKGNINRAIEALDGNELGPDEFGEMVQGALQAPQLTQEGAKQLIPEIQAMVEKHPENMLLQVALGDYHSWAGDVEQARAAYLKILEKDANFIPALNNLAMILAASNVRVDEAVQAIDQAVNLSGPTDYLLDTRGIVKLAAGDLAGAESDMRQSITGAARADRYFHLAQILLAQGRRADAKQALETAQKEGVSIEVLHPIERAAYQKLVDDLK